MLDLLSMLLAPALVVGVLLGLAGAFLLHGLAPSPEPVFVEAMLVALGFIGGLACTWWFEVGKR